MADRRRPGARWVEGSLRVMLRYSIALGLVSYAIAKLLPQQFPPLTPMGYETRVGELSPMGLLWTFMRYSRPYSLFGGVMESVAIVLLCFRRTATLGALVTAAVMTNVALMNLAYDVQVKLYAIMLVVSAAVLIAYDLPRLLRVFVTNTAVPAARQPTLFEGRLPESVRWGLKILLVGSVALSSVSEFRSLAAPTPAVAAVSGAWGLSSFSLDRPNAKAWRRIIVDGDRLVVRLDDDSLMYCRLSGAASLSGMPFVCGRDRAGDLTWTRSGDQWRLTGTFGGATLAASARRLDDRDYPLMRGGFHVIYDRR
jgi:hypothetical protein